MRDYLNIGPTPSDEPCLGLGTPEYDATKAKAECRRFRDEIRRVCGPEVGSASLQVKGFPHDFGTYYEVVCVYDEMDELGTKYAFHVEANSPENWNEPDLSRRFPCDPS